MVYTVGEMAAKLLDIPASTLRYYDKEGLLPFVERSSGGIRLFRKSDFEWLQVIGCMKKAGMSIRDIRQYIQLAMQGDDTIDADCEDVPPPAGFCWIRSGRCSTRWRQWNTSAGFAKLTDGAGRRHHGRPHPHGGGGGSPALPGHPAGASRRGAGEGRCVGVRFSLLTSSLRDGMMSVTSEHQKRWRGGAGSTSHREPGTVEARRTAPELLSLPSRVPQRICQ